MKIRLGFVSNSSSSSFCMLGLTQTELENYLPSMEENEEFSISDYIENKLEKYPEISTKDGIADFYEETIIGFEVYNLDKDKTINQSKKELKNKLDEIFDTDINIDDIGFCVDGGNDD